MPKSKVSFFYPVFALFIFLLTFQGINLSDEGYHLLNQWTAWNYPQEYIWGFTWLTDWIGGGWLNLTEPLGILGYRLGWVICFLATLYVVYLLNKENKIDSEVRRWVIYYFAGAFLIHGVMAPDYLVLPALVSTLALALVYAGMGRQKWTAIVAGAVLLGLLPAFRFPMLVVWSIPVLILIWERIRTGRFDRFRAQATGVAIFIAVVSFATLMGALSLLGYLDEHLEYFRRAFFYVSAGHSHNPSNLLGLYLREVMTLPLRDGLQFLLISWLVVVAHRKWKGRYFHFILTCILVGYFTYTGVTSPNFSGNRRMIMALLVFLSVFLLARNLIRKIKFQSLEVYLLCGLFLGLAGMVGSENGLGVSIYFSGLIWGPLLVLALMSFPQYRVVAKSLALTVLISSVGIRLVNTYLDSRNRLELTQPISACPDLIHVYTSAARANAFNGLCEFLGEMKSAKKTFVVTNQAPLVYYLGRQLPPLYYSWLESSDKRDFEIFQSELIKNPRNVWIVAGGIPSRNGWPLNDLVSYDRSLNEGMAQAESMRAHLGYTQLVWENSGFKAYSRGGN